jgi:hypothetical protein
MKKILMISLMLMIGTVGFSQSVTEVMAEQIAKLQLYLNWLKKGYSIASKGLTLINDLKHGDFNMFQDYFNSLEQVKGPIKEDAKIAAMIAMQVQIVTRYQSYYHKVQASSTFTAQELTYVYNFYSLLLDDAGTDIDALTDVISDGKLQMKDDERISRINQLYKSMMGKYEAFYSFSNQIGLQAQQRQSDKNCWQNLQNLY